MILCLDVDYKTNKAQTAGILFSNWTDETGVSDLKVVTSPIAPYESGQFYKRELPCLMALVKKVHVPPDFIVVDSYVWLAKDKKGMGAYLYEALDGKIPVIGVAKKKFLKAAEVEQEILRGESQNPLLITAAGIETAKAADFIRQMHGEFRVPTLLKEVDALCRNWE